MTARVMAQRFAFLLLLSAALALMLLGKADNRFIERLRGTIADVAAPVLAVLAEPVAAANRFVAEINQLVALHGENVRLRAENERLRHWQAVALKLEQENAALKELVNVDGAAKSSGYVTARVIGDSGGPFVRTLLLDVGTGAGVTRGQAAVNADGLIGRVVEAADRSSRLLLLTDLNSRVPVITESSRRKAILSGDNTDRPRLVFLATGERVQPGERIVTSGHGGIFPPGLPVGIVGSASEAQPRVQPFVKWHRLEFVRILRFEHPARAPDGVTPVEKW